MMETLECTRGAVADAFIRVAPVYTRPAAQAAECQLLLPPVRSHFMGGVRLHEVKDLGRGAWLDSLDAKTGIHFTTFPTRLGPPPDSPPVN